MKLKEKIRLIDDMIREDPESTIADYIHLLSDIQSIEQNELHTEIQSGETTGDSANIPEPRVGSYLFSHGRVAYYPLRHPGGKRYRPGGSAA